MILPVHILNHKGQHAYYTLHFISRLTVAEEQWKLSVCAVSLVQKCLTSVKFHPTRDISNGTIFFYPSM
jgi:hypothetical protein